MIWRNGFLAAAFVLVGACLAQAGSIIVNTTHSNPPLGQPTAGVQGVANVIKVSFTDSSPQPSLSGQQLLLNLTAGQILNTSGGTNGGTVAPFADDIAGKPSLAYDSFLAMGGLTADDTVGGDSANILLVGGAANLGGASGLTFPSNSTSKKIDATWAPGTGQFVAPAQNYITAQITLSSDAQGTWSYYSTTADGTTKTLLNQKIINGVMIPEPASICLMGLGLLGMAGLIRRRG